jgi:glycosyltransferase involved in cell wall biosynthesis
LALQKVKLVIIGDLKGPEKKWYDESVPQTTKDLISITGWLPYHQVGDMISKCHIGLITMNRSINNMLAGPPNKLFNYMRYGLPIISVNFPESQRIIHDYKCGIVVKDDSAEAFVEGINFIIDNPVKADNMGDNGRAAINDVLSWEHQSNKLISLYDELLGDTKILL